MSLLLRFAVWISPPAEPVSRRGRPRLPRCGSRMKDVQRKLDLSLEDLVEESKSGGGRQSTRKRRRVRSEEAPEKAPKSEKEPAEKEKAESEKEDSKEEKREEDRSPRPPRRDWHAEPRRRTEADLAAGARRTGRPPSRATPWVDPSEPSPATSALRPAYPPLMPAWPGYPPYRAPMYLRPVAPPVAPVFRPPPYAMPLRPQNTRWRPSYPPAAYLWHPVACPGRGLGLRHSTRQVFLDILSSLQWGPCGPGGGEKRHRERAPAGPPPPQGFQVRLSNIPQELTAKDLAEAFTEVSSSRVESVDLLRDGAGRATGDAVIIFAAMPDAQNAVRRYHGGDLNGRRLEAIYEGEVKGR
ncbi:unnamed protein product [Durusdinium trenchii]|uniref:RRM domain-containing protein n=1 Tax=Durusdinium trenchii TaxID=1381693 RepID=A0ABP0LEU3_9DINO